MGRQNKKTSKLPYVVTLSLLAFYNVGLIIYALRLHDGLNLVLYSLIPDTLGVYMGLHGFHQNTFFEQHTERHMRRHDNDLDEIKTYVRAIAGVPEEFNS
jgi:hypothetical protein